MGTWMIHFLCPELKSQHLGKVEASVPAPPAPILHLPTKASGLAVLVSTAKGIGQGCCMWPGLRPLLQASLEVISCEPGGFLAGSWTEN